jgi:transcriptional regulator with XRE-family HTH domain
MNAPGRATKPLSELLETQNKAKLARKLGIDPSTVARWARGESVPSGDNLQALARLLDVDTDSIDLQDAPSQAVA